MLPLLGRLPPALAQPCPAGPVYCLALYTLVLYCLQSSCNVVMAGLVNTLLPLFMGRLAEDYRKWASDAAYRAHRAASRRPLEQVGGGSECERDWVGSGRFPATAT